MADPEAGIPLCDSRIPLWVRRDTCRELYSSTCITIPNSPRAKDVLVRGFPLLYHQFVRRTGAMNLSISRRFRNHAGTDISGVLEADRSTRLVERRSHASIHETSTSFHFDAEAVRVFLQAKRERLVWWFESCRYSERSPEELDLEAGNLTERKGDCWHVQRRIDAGKTSDRRWMGIMSRVVGVRLDAIRE